MRRLTWLLVFVLFAWTGVGAQAQSLVPAGSPLPPGWQEVVPGGDTMCQDGSPWKFYVARGDPAKLVVDFQGGGACWTDQTCGPKSQTFKKVLDINELYLAQGIYNRASVANPFFGWTHVFVPYCTADIHWGNATVKYGDVTIQHKGAVNARAVLAWTAQNIPAPKQVFVTGCSAGGYGASMWAPYYMRLYPQASVRELADASIGVVTDGFASTGFKNWQAEGALPDWIPALAAARQDISTLRQPDLYAATGAAYPKATVGQVTSALDGTQIYFYGLMKGQAQPDAQTAGEWVTGAQANLAAAKTGSPNNVSYVWGGGTHCVLPRPELYTAKVGDVTLLDWVKGLIGPTQPADVNAAASK